MVHDQVYLMPGGLGLPVALPRHPQAAALINAQLIAASFATQSVVSYLTCGGKADTVKGGMAQCIYGWHDPKIENRL